MNSLHLSGYGIKLVVRDLENCSELEVTDGHLDERLPKIMSFRPRHFPYDSIVIEGKSGFVSLQALHWLAANQIPMFQMGWDGKLITSTLPPMPFRADIRSAQFRASTDPQERLKIGKCFIRAKLQRTLEVLAVLRGRTDVSKAEGLIRRNVSLLENVDSLGAVRLAEAEAALPYWRVFRGLLPEILGFRARRTQYNNSEASDPVNSALNYGYGLLEAECLKAVRCVGLEPSIGFVHEHEDANALVYDFMEPWRWLVDITVLDAFTSKLLGIEDFYFTGDDYTYRFEAKPKQKFIGALRQQFRPWDTSIEASALRLVQYLNGESKELELSTPQNVQSVQVGSKWW